MDLCRCSYQGFGNQLLGGGHKKIPKLCVENVDIMVSNLQQSLSMHFKYLFCS